MIRGYIQFKQNGKTIRDPFTANELIEVHEFVNNLKMGGIKNIKVVFKGSTIGRKRAKA